MPIIAEGRDVFAMFNTTVIQSSCIPNAYIVQFQMGINVTALTIANQFCIGILQRTFKSLTIILSGCYGLESSYTFRKTTHQILISIRNSGVMIMAVFQRY